MAVHTATRLERLGDFRILREVARGGMGVVYEAEQVSLGRRVALKLLPDSALADTKQVLRFEREARAAARLHHTNIVPVFGAGHDDGHHFYVMQFIPGMGLDAVLEELRRLRGGARREPAGPTGRTAARFNGVGGHAAAEVAEAILTGRFSPTEAARRAALQARYHAGKALPRSRSARPLDPPNSWCLAPGRWIPSVVSLPFARLDLLARSDPDRLYFRSVARIGQQVAEALEYANRQGVLHRDIKPANLLLDPKGNVWVADFGLAKATDTRDVTQTGDIIAGHGAVHGPRSGLAGTRCDARSGRLLPWGCDPVRAAGVAAGLRRRRPPRELMRRVMSEEPAAAAAAGAAACRGTWRRSRH